MDVKVNFVAISFEGVQYGHLATSLSMGFCWLTKDQTPMGILERTLN